MNNNNRQPSEACMNYLKSVMMREENMPLEGLCFTNCFDKGIQFKKDLFQLIPDLGEQLQVAEIDAIINLVADKTCETLREKGLLSEESREILCR